MPRLVKRARESLSAAFAGLCVTCFLSVSVAHSQDVVVDRGLSIRGAFVFYLSRFIAWPLERHEAPEVPFIFCVIDDATFRRHLEEDLRGRTMRGMQVVVKGYDSEEIAGKIEPACDLALFDKESQAARKVLEGMADRSVLTIGTADGFLDRGGVIRVYPSGNKMHFILNLTAAKRARLQFTSEILELADAIIWTDRPAGNPTVAK